MDRKFISNSCTFSLFPVKDTTRPTSSKYHGFNDFNLYRLKSNPIINSIFYVYGWKLNLA